METAPFSGAADVHARGIFAARRCLPPQRAIDPRNLTGDKTMHIQRTLIALASAAVLAACGSMGSTPASVADGALTGPNGMTLYTFDKDPAGGGKSACNGQCATNWPPLFAEGSAGASGDYSIVMRDDGRKQWAYKGKPLYYWVKDKQPGDKTGDGVNKVWHTAMP
jgi:predicted lipoprotein with Yx(FWY)xxD motif